MCRNYTGNVKMRGIIRQERNKAHFSCMFSPFFVRVARNPSNSIGLGKTGLVPPEYKKETVSL
jgi:hypothetical protein